MQVQSESSMLAAFSRISILVIGDVMLDEYVWGEVRRISPEAPVPVVEAKRRTYAAGGAGNVAVNVVSLRGRALLGGVVGDDPSCRQLRDVLTASGVNVSGLIVDTERPTTTKTRIVAHSQQMVRVDSEERRPLNAFQQRQLVDWAARHMETVGCCVLSDYNKGLISHSLAQEIISLAKHYDKPVVVDPKGNDYTKYRGATVVKPNVHEAERATHREIHSDADVLAAGKTLSTLLEGSALLITRGADGMSLFAYNQEPVHISTIARSVYDVTGAGDTVVSALALALAAGSPLETAARLANRAGGIVVGKLGTAHVSLEELAAEDTIETAVQNAEHRNIMRLLKPL